MQYNAVYLYSFSPTILIWVFSEGTTDDEYT